MTTSREHEKWKPFSSLTSTGRGFLSKRSRSKWMTQTRSLDPGQWSLNVPDTQYAHTIITKSGLIYCVRTKTQNIKVSETLCEQSCGPCQHTIGYIKNRIWNSSFNSQTGEPEWVDSRCQCVLEPIWLMIPILSMIWSHLGCKAKADRYFKKHVSTCHDHWVWCHLATFFKINF